MVLVLVQSDAGAAKQTQEQAGGCGRKLPSQTRCGRIGMQRGAHSLRELHQIAFRNFLKGLFCQLHRPAVLARSSEHRDRVLLVLRYYCVLALHSSAAHLYLAFIPRPQCFVRLFHNNNNNNGLRGIVLSIPYVLSERTSQ